MAIMDLIRCYIKNALIVVQVPIVKMHKEKGVNIIKNFVGCIGFILLKFTFEYYV